MNRRRILIIFASLLSGTSLWFLAVDSSWFVESCIWCGMSRDELQYRVFTIPVHGEVFEFRTIPQLVAEDLGAPCPHHIRRWHKHRWWGLCYCARPCIDGIYRLVGDEWYGEKHSRFVKELAENNPSLRKEFQRALLSEDRRYIVDFVGTIRKRVPA